MSRMGTLSDLPTAVLEERAIEQRRRIHNAVGELRQQVVGAVREKLDVENYAREYVWRAAGAAALFGLMIGHGVAGIFKR